MEARVLFCDNHLLVLSKPAGMLTQPNESDDSSLEECGKLWLKNKFQKPGNVFLHAAHRIDRPVSGVVLFARTSKALSRLNSFIRNNQFQKEYLAHVEGNLSQNASELEHYLLRGDFITTVVAPGTPNAKKCTLSYECLENRGDYSVVKIQLLTGRYHQIRAQFSAIGHPIIGDQKYGSKIVLPHIHLHHAKLTFPHPVTQAPLTFHAPIPEWENASFQT